MPDGWDEVPLGEVAVLDIDRVAVEAGLTYPIAGVLNAGQGLFARDAIDGSQTNYPALHRLHEGQLVMRKLTAWEGPIACVPADFEGYFVSAEFPTFTLSERLLPGYMSLVCQQPSFWEAMKDRSTGSVQRRKRVSPSQLLRIPIQLPPLTEQRRIVDLMAAMDGAVSSLARAESVAMDAYLAMLRRFFGDEMRDCDTVPLSELAETRLGKMLDSKRLAGDVYPYLANIDVRWDAVNIEGLKSVPLTDRERQDLDLRAGDALVCEGGEVGRTAVLAQDLLGIYFQKAVHRVRFGPRLRPRFFLHFMKYATTNGLLADYVSALTIQHLTGEKLRLIPIPLPSVSQQDSIVALLDDFLGFARSASATAERATHARSSILAELLEGQREVPATYDRFLDDVA